MTEMTPIQGPLIDARNVAVTFKVEGGTVEAVRDVSFQVWPGKTTALVGESGSGPLMRLPCSSEQVAFMLCSHMGLRSVPVQGGVLRRV